LVAAALFCVGIVTGWLFLKESLESKKNDRDYGLIVGGRITTWVRKTLNISKREKGHPEREPLLTSKDHIEDEESSPNEAREVREIESKPRIRDVLSYQTTLNLGVYTLLALYTMAYDQVGIWTLNADFQIC
jgi:hypothetical protein